MNRFFGRASDSRVARVKSRYASAMALGLAVLIAPASQLFAEQAGGPVVHVMGGDIEGVANDGVISFKGVPLGEPPVGALRWAYAKPAKTWTGVRKADTYAPPCMQKPSPILGLGNVKPSEDCLYLNVWTTDLNKSAKKPVMVHIYGGGFTLGSTSMPMVEGSALARKGAVLVTLPYRVGTLGYLAHPELTKESPHHASGNYAMSDLVLGLQWVRDNIAQFGGDPSNVTIFGCSAGGHMSSYLVTSPPAKGLFQRAIAESGSQFTHGFETPNMAPLAESEQMGVEIAKNMGATTLAEMRAVPADKVIAAQNEGLTGGVMALPNADGYYLPVDQWTAFKTGRQNRIDLMTGWCSNEGLMFANRWKQWDTAEELQAYAKKFAPGLEQEFLKAYPSDTPEQARLSGVWYSGDELFGYQNYKLAQGQALSGRKTFVYFFERLAGENKMLRGMAPGFPDSQYAGLHCGNSSYSSGNLRSFGNPNPTPSDLKLSETLMSYWFNFARTGNPNGPGLPEWPAYDATSKAKVLRIQETVSVDVLPSMSRMLVLDKIYEARRASAASSVSAAH